MPDGNQVVDLFANDLNVVAFFNADISNVTLLGELRAVERMSGTAVIVLPSTQAKIISGIPPRGWR